MANDLFVVADFVADALDVDPTEASEVLNAAPLVAATPISDTSDGSETHQWNVHTGDPVVGFRSPNAGRDYDHSVDTVKTTTCTILDFSWRVDYAVANAWRKGPENLIMREGMRHLAAALYKLETQILYGATALGDANGFAGLIDNANYDALADDMVFNKAGATADSQNSIWALKFGFNDIRLVTPMSRGISLGETIVTEANDTNHPVYYTPASMYIGLQVGNKYSAGRIANIETAVDDDDIAELLAAFPVGKKPDSLWMNRTVQRYLQNSRTATNSTGAPAPFPESAFGFPISTTDALVSTEAVEV